MKSVTQRLQLPPVFAPVVTGENATQQAIEQPELTVTLNYNSEEIGLDAISKAVSALQRAGMSDTAIIKDVLGYEGSRYRKGREILNKLKRGDLDGNNDVSPTR